MDASISDLTFAEFSVTLWRKVREGALTEAAMRTAVNTLDAHCDAGLYDLQPMTSAHFLAVRGILDATARTSSGVLRTLDALHLAAARASNASLLTFDHRLATVARAVGINVLP